MLEILIAREAKVAQKELDLEEKIKVRDEIRRRESETYTVGMINTQATCKHLKGSGTRRRNQQRDPNVFFHTFQDGTRMVKCNSCRMKWFPQDTRDFLTRNGSAIPNWTHLGWKDAVELCEDSSNRPSSSERFGAPQDAKTPEADAAVKKLPANVQL